MIASKNDLIRWRSKMPSLKASLAIFFSQLIVISICHLHNTEKSFVIDYKNNQFLKDSKSFRYISGGIHYFRIPRIHWQDRLQKAQALGLNTIQTYIAWNVHEETPGQYDFDGNKDLLHFIDLAEKYNFLVIIRPGPYIDAEWEFGGFPWWLARDPTLQMRTHSDIRYMEYVRNWFNVLLNLLKPKLYKNGGPIIAFQIENEYGNYYACDKLYMQQLQQIFLSILGDDVVMFTTDGYTDDYLQCGTIPSLYKTIDFGTEITAQEAFMQQRKYEPHGPLVNSEFYTGWLDYWGKPHQTRDLIKIAEHFDQILFLNASVNLYMLIGGTNFGFMNGADMNKKGEFLISPTSYDYDAPLSEAGDPRLKYYALREVIKKYTTKTLKPVPNATEKARYGKFSIKIALTLQEAISKLYPKGPPVTYKHPLTFESVNQSYGFLLYEALIPSKYRQVNVIDLFIEKVHDRSTIYIDDYPQVIFPRGAVNVSISSGEKLGILVENQGRVAYASKGIHYLPDAKGILGNVYINNEAIKNWNMFPMNDKNINRLANDMSYSTGFLQRNMDSGMFYFASFEIRSIADTYINMNGWTKGQIYINDFNIGRYWQVKGPQKTLFVPKNALNIGHNRLLILELVEAPCDFTVPHQCFIEFVDKPILG